MKSLPLQTPAYRYLEQSFKEWLDVLGYAPSTVYYMPLQVRELLHHLERHGIRNITELDNKHIKAYYHKLKERSNTRRGGALSTSHLNKHIQAIRKFTDYLRQVGRLTLPDIPLKNEENNEKTITVLTEAEIQLLFKATYAPPAHYNLSEETMEAMQSRDRAMLAILYGCGLRRNEAASLDTGDINFDRSMLHVRKGKNYKERFVPISKTSLKYLQEYLYDHRGTLQIGKSEALFLGHSTARLSGQSLYLRLKYLQHQTEDATLMEKEIGLHTLRHSIATHLLAAGMPLESIARFLGHTSLESTQLYTHLSAVAYATAKASGDMRSAKEDLLNQENSTVQPYNNIHHHERIQLSEDEL